MLSFIPFIIVGVVLIVIGITNLRGNISSLHSYHTHRVSEQDRLPLGKRVGVGKIILGASVILLGISSSLAILLENKVFMYVGTGVFFVAATVGSAISLFAIIKYNKGLF